MTYPDDLHEPEFDAEKALRSNKIAFSGVNPRHRGKSLGKQLYRSVAMWHGDLESGSLVSPAAHKVWQGLDNTPGFETSLAPYHEGSAEPHATRYHGGADPKQLFPKVKIDTKSAPKPKVKPKPPLKPKRKPRAA